MLIGKVSAIPLSFFATWTLFFSIDFFVVVSRVAAPKNVTTADLNLRESFFKWTIDFNIVKTVSHIKWLEKHNQI